MYMYVVVNSWDAGDHTSLRDYPYDGKDPLEWDFYETLHPGIQPDDVYCLHGTHTSGQINTARRYIDRSIQHADIQTVQYSTQIYRHINTARRYIDSSMKHVDIQQMYRQLNEARRHIADIQTVQ